MQKNNVIQFTGFSTRLDGPAFMDQWTQFARQNKYVPGSLMLLEKTGGPGKFNYLTRHVFSQDDYGFPFVKGKHSENFPDQGAKVAMLGGYSISGPVYADEKGISKIIVCFTRDIVDVPAYRELAADSALYVYEPFYENSAYSLILEFMTRKNHTDLLLEALMKRKESTEIAVYRNCRVPQLVP